MNNTNAKASLSLLLQLRLRLLLFKLESLLLFTFKFLFVCCCCCFHFVVFAKLPACCTRLEMKVQQRPLEEWTLSWKVMFVWKREKKIQFSIKCGDPPIWTWVQLSCTRRPEYYLPTPAARSLSFALIACTVWEETDCNLLRCNLIADSWVKVSRRPALISYIKWDEKIFVPVWWVWEWKGMSQMNHDILYLQRAIEILSGPWYLCLYSSLSTQATLNGCWINALFIRSHSSFAVAGDCHHSKIHLTSMGDCSMTH